MFKAKEGGTTTGQVVSRLGVLTVLANNVLDENHVDLDARADYGREIEAMYAGLRGVPAEKLAVRSVERCAAGRWN